MHDEIHWHPFLPHANRERQSGPNAAIAPEPNEPSSIGACTQFIGVS